jgi:DeoR family glycerol-3-phosphate regulon repressor
MNKTARQAVILERVSSDGSFQVSRVAEDLDVSEETIRRDIKEMERKGLLQRRHGGATLPQAISDTPYQSRMRQNATGKREIGKAIAKLVNDGDSVLIETGTTATYIAQALRDRRGLTVVTNSVDVARSLAFRPQNEVYMAGGRLTPDDAASIGQHAIEYVRTFRLKYAILSAAGIDLVDGLMAYRVEEAEFSRAVMSRVETVILAIDQTKFGKRGLVTIGPLAAADIIVTDAPPSAELQRALERDGVRLVVTA